MQKNNNGFTLIELLVVVLIIGILAAVALPQYQKAVMKARVTQEVTVFNAYSKAIDAWILANGWPATNTDKFVFTGTDSCSGRTLNSLDIEMSSQKSGCADVVKDSYVGAFLNKTVAFITTRPKTGGCYARFDLKPGANNWVLSTIGLAYANETYPDVTNASATDCPDYQKMMCDYWATLNGLADTTAKTQCARFGITLNTAS